MDATMPILPAEPALFPDHLFDEQTPPLEVNRAWWALHTKPRQEKRLAQHLHERRIAFFLPLISRKVRIRARVVLSHLPLFPGYVFVLGNWEERVTALATGRVVQSLTVVNQHGLWHDLRQIRKLIASGAPLTPEGQLLPGATVEIRSGPLAGLRGTIINSVSGRRFLVRVDFIQRGASVLLDEVGLVKVND
jgi:transcription antitermination factor NusG